MLLLDSVPELRERSSKTKLLNPDRHPEYLPPSVTLKCLDFLASFIDSALVNLSFHAHITAHVRTDLLLYVSVTVF